MFNGLKGKFGYIVEIFSLLTAQDRVKILALGLTQFILSLLDLFGILLIGIVTSLGLSAISSTPIPKTISFIFDLPLMGGLPLEELIIWLSLISAILLLSKTIASALIMKKIVGFLALREALISASYMKNVSNHSPNWQLEKSPQYISGIAIEGANSAFTVTLGQVVSFAVEALSLSIILIGVSSFDASITLPSFMLFVFSGWITLRILATRVKESGREEFSLGISSRDLIKQMVVGSRELFLSNKQGEMNQRFAIERLKNYKAVRTRAFSSLIPKYVSELTMILGGAIIALYQFAIKDANGAITALVIFAGLASRLLPSLLRIQGAVLQIRGCSVASKTFLEEFQKSRIPHLMKKGSIDLDRLIGGDSEEFVPLVSIRNVSMKRGLDSSFQISDVSLEIQAGEFLAIVGPSGSGKTTLIDLMLGIIEPSAGQVLISGVHTKLAIERWPSSIRYVPQDIYLINGSILENVIWPDVESRLDNQEIGELFRVVQLDSWIKSLHEGWYTHINDLGTNLSGGQKQRIGIARALYASPKLLFLDESTSSLDFQTEQEIVNEIILNMGSITRIVIAHRISTIKFADRIVYMRDGNVILVGSYAEVKDKFPELDHD